MGDVADALTAPRPPRYADAVELYQQGREAIAEGDRAHALSQARQEAYVRAAALFAGAQAAAAIRLIVPVNIAATGITDTGHTAR